LHTYFSIICFVSCEVAQNNDSDDKEYREWDTMHLMPIFSEKFPGTFRDSIEKSYLLSCDQIAKNIELVLFPYLDSLVFD